MNLKRNSKYFEGAITGVMITLMVVFGLQSGETVEERRNISQLNEKFGQLIIPSRMRILCYVHTCPEYHKTKAQAVKDTWGKRCDKLLFLTTKPEEGMETIIVKAKETRQSIWIKEREAVKAIYDQYLNDYDWFIKADDDAFVIMENLKYMLIDYDAEDPVAIGTPYFHDNKRTDINEEFMDGGSGYVMSREAVRRYGDRGYHNEKLCKPKIYTSEQDILISKCLRNLGVTLLDSRDEKGKERMVHFPLRDVIAGRMYGNQKNWKKFEIKNGTSPMSNMAITFHWLAPEDLYEMEYFIYNLTLFDF